MQPSRQLYARWTAIVLTCALVALCALGVFDAIEGGKYPGYVQPGTPWPYPTEGVMWTCGIILAETLVLYLILRPNTLVQHPHRVLITVAVFAPYWIMNCMLMMTDQSGYYYSNEFFLFCVALLLALLSAITWLNYLYFDPRKRRRSNQDLTATIP